jgi:hypothetical protein
MNNWNPLEEHIQGKLCEKGLMQERYDDKVNDLVRNLTPKGRNRAEELLKDPEWRRAYLKIAKIQIDKLPLPLRKILWKRIANQLRNLRKE